MSVHKSLVSKLGMNRARNVYTRTERIEILKKEGRLTGELHVVGLPKTRVVKALKKAAKVDKKAEEKAATGGAAAPAKGAAGAAAKGAAAKPAAAKPAAADKKAAPAKK